MNPRTEIDKLHQQFKFALISENKHYKFQDPAGRIHVMSKTPSDFRADRNALMMLKRIVQAPPPASRVLEEEAQKKEIDIFVKAQPKQCTGMSGPAKTEGTGFTYYDVLDPEKKLSMFTPQAAREQREIEALWDKQLRYFTREVKEVEEKYRTFSRFVSDYCFDACLGRATKMLQFDEAVVRVIKAHNHKFGYALVDQISRFCFKSLFEYIEECMPDAFDYVLPVNFYEPLFPFRYQLESASLSQDANRLFRMLWSLQENSWCSTERVPYALSTDSQTVIRKAAEIHSRHLSSKQSRALNRTIDNLCKQSSVDAPAFPQVDFAELETLVEDWQEERMMEEIDNLPMIIAEDDAAETKPDYSCLFKDDDLVVHARRYPTRNRQDCWTHNRFDYCFHVRGDIPSDDYKRYKLALKSTPINHNQVLCTELQEIVEFMRRHEKLPANFSKKTFEQLESIFDEQHKMLAGRKNVLKEAA